MEVYNILTESQKRAHANHVKKVKRYSLMFYPNSEEDKEIFEHLNKQENRQTYLKGLILEDMKKK